MRATAASPPALTTTAWLPCVSLVSGEVQVVAADGVSLAYPGTYGLHACGRHDSGLEPDCNSTGYPGWCEQEWCYVDPLSCNTETGASAYIPGLVYSYKACGFSNEFESAFFSPMREQSFGGAFFQRNSYSFTSLEQCTIKTSRAEKGGGFFLGDGASTVTKSTIVGNTATTGSNLYADNGVFSYVLPAPLGHWVSGTNCSVYRYPCPLRRC